MTRYSHNIAVVGQFYTDSFSLHIAETIARMGHTVIRYEVGLAPRLVSHGTTGRILRAAHGTWRRVGSHSALIAGRRDERLLEAVRGADVVLAAHDLLAPRAVALLKRRLGVPIAIWCPDHVASFGRGMFLNAAYDAVFVKDPSIVLRIRRESATRAYYLPECCNPLEHRPVELSDIDQQKYGCEIATAGNMYPSRAAFFSELAEFDVRIWGNAAPSWMDISAVSHMMRSEYVTGATKAKAFLAAKVVLNNLHHAEISGLNARAFEICGIGGFQIVSWREGSEDLFTSNREVVTYRNIADLKTKLGQYLSDGDEREAIAAAGHKRAVSEHTYAHRLELLLSTLEGRDKGFPLPVRE